MILSLALLTLLMAILGGWLFRHSWGARPWEAQVAGQAPQRQAPPGATPARVGLGVILAVATSLFALTVSAYLMRLELGSDWRPLAMPGVLWVNTLLLVAASLALQRAWRAARDGRARALRTGLAWGGGLSLAFLVGQGLAWWQLTSAGATLQANPAGSFFYLLTLLHGLHLLGGLVAWWRAWRRLGRGGDIAAGVELCALYWHYLLVIWGVLFALLLLT
ncbi:cytochrome c oxidase subunit 3 [Halomonas salifodinae]|uniref:cytochrome c oxidase subunit 3 n=1 Tax=Halomonas salifodinae TaxID=438745 RepID=UPI0033ABB85D